MGVCAAHEASEKIQMNECNTTTPNKRTFRLEEEVSWLLAKWSTSVPSARNQGNPIQNIAASTKPRLQT